MKKLIKKLIEYDYEKRALLNAYECYLPNKGSNILDVGCGYGRILKELRNRGYENILGVEKNIEIVNSIKGDLPVVSDKEFIDKWANKKFDAINLSHIIEHFEPLDLIKFLEFYSAYLKPNGFLFITTPLMHKGFYDDFDHIKPYNPQAFDNVFVNKDSQMQYGSKLFLERKYIWIRRSPLRPRWFSGLFVSSLSSKVNLLLSLFSSLVFLLSVRILGVADGWLGIYQLKEFKKAE